MISFQSSIIDLGISIVFIVLLFSIFHSGLLELIQMYLRMRNHFLYIKLNDAFNDRYNYNLCEKLYNHPVIESVKPKSSTFPAYISSEFFAEAMMGVLSKMEPMNQLQLKNGKECRAIVFESTEKAMESPEAILQQIKNNLRSFNHSNVKELLVGIIMPASTLEEVKTRLMKWYEGYMDRISSQYKKKINKWSIPLGIGIAIFCNANLIVISKSLKNDSNLNNRISSLAIQMHESGKLSEMAKTPAYEDLGFATSPPGTGYDSLFKAQNHEMDSIYQEVKKMGLPIGWGFPQQNLCEGQCNSVHTCCEKNNSTAKGIANYVKDFIAINFRDTNWFYVFFGYLLMGMAMSFGSENWFNILTKLINIRGVIKPEDNKSSKK